MKEKIKDLIYIMLIVSMVGLFSYAKSNNKTICNNTTNSVSEYIIIKDTLSEWQLFVMALVEVECERNPNTKSNKNAIGPFQITPIYVKEVNRLYNTSFVFEDAWDLEKSLEMFNLMNDYYNSEKDIDKAIKLHNPGAGKWYSDRIKQRMKMIKFSEEVRTKLKD